MSSRGPSGGLRVAEGLAAFVALAVLVGGIPWALWHFVGWPLPHHVPTAAQVGRALERQGIPAQALVDALAVVVWICWASLVASTAAEIPAALSGRRARRLPVAGVFQPLTGRLVAAVVVAGLALAPRPVQPGTASSRSALGAAIAGRPVAALVVTDASNRPAATVAATPPSPTATRPVHAADGPAAAALTPYVVQRGDTLWGIAERMLGDPLRWSEIYQLNAGRPQPEGITLDNPHWIDPGWTLLLPSPTPPPPGPAPAVPTTPPPMTSPPSPTGASGLPPGAAGSPSSATAPGPTATAPLGPRGAPAGSAPVAPSAEANGAGARRTPAPPAPVRLPSGSVVAGSFAAGVAATVALGRLRRRHAYRYRPPAPGRDLRAEPARPTLAHLVRASGAAAPGDDAAEVLAVFPLADDERRLDPGLLEVGVRHATAVAVELADLSGVAVDGPGADEVLRALLAGLLVRAGPGAAEVVLSSKAAERLVPGLSAVAAVRCLGLDRVARVVEVERLARTRRLEAAGAKDAASFRHDNPENPLPLLFVVVCDLPPESLGRWSGLLADAGRLGICVLFVDDTPAATGRLHLGPGRTVTDAEPAALAERLADAQLHGLRADETVELLGALSAAEDDGKDEGADAEPPGVAAPDGIGRAEQDGGLLQHRAAAGLAEELADEPWPEPASPLAGRDQPLVVEVLGPYRISLFGRPVPPGLRARAKMLLAWCLLRPEGVTIDEAVDALWPDTPPGRVLKVFWHPLGDLRSFFRDHGGEALEVLEKLGEHYRPSPAEICCDLWDFQAALAEAARADDAGGARAGLRRAVDTFRGDLLQGADYPWVEPVRADLHRRALDAHLRLAELDEQAGHLDAAVAVLERAIELDRYAEEPYRRLMVLHAAHGHHEALAAVWQCLGRRLADLDVDMDPATIRLYRSLAASDERAGDPRPARLAP